MATFSVPFAVWSSIDVSNGLEYVWFRSQSAFGTILRQDEHGQPFQVSYEFRWDESFLLQSAIIQSFQQSPRRLDLTFHSVWHDHGKKIPGFENCVDLDLWPTPLTNTFATKRLDLAVGQTSEIDVLWIEAPMLQWRKEKQRYTRLNNTCYLFENPSSNFEARIEFDNDGLVLKYPGLFERKR